MNLRINVGVINKLKQAGLYVDNLFGALFILRALEEDKSDLLDFADDASKSKRMIIMYYELTRKGLLEESQDTPNLFSLTDMGRKLLSELDEELEQKPIESQTETKEVVPDEKTLSVDDWFNEWMDLFPTGVKSGGKLVRSDVKSCLTKMKKFVKDYPKFTKDIILSVTRDYLAEREADGWLYTKCAVYFIDKKGEGSELASLCEEALSTPKQSATTASYSNGLI